MTLKLSPDSQFGSGWRMVRFDEIAESINERVDPAETDLDVYVGLEHLDPESLKIRRWGTPDDVTGQKLRFRAGDIIFGKRRAYQRKLAVADFDGICSAHAMVLRAKTELIEPDFLPFFMQSDMFMERAIDISVGSLSPTINWKILRIQEFPIPPKDEQYRIAGILQCAVDCVERLTQVREATRIARNTSHRELTLAVFRVADLPNVLPDGWKVYSLGEVCEIANQLRKPINSKDRSEMQGEYPYYGPTGVLDHINEYRAEGEYTLIGEDGDHFLKYLDWDMTQLITGKFNVNNHAHMLKGKLCSTKWVFHYFKHRNIRAFLARQGAGRLKLNKASLEAIPIAVPPPKEENRIINILDQHDECLGSATKHLHSQQELLVRLREEMLWSKGDNSDVQ